MPTGIATPEAQGVVSAPDTIVTAGKAVAFSGVAAGFKNAMLVLPDRGWISLNADAKGAFSVTVDLTGFDTGPLPARIFGWYDTPDGERQVAFDVTLLLDNPTLTAIGTPPVPPQVKGMTLQHFDDFTGPTLDPAWGVGCRQDGSQWGSSARFLERGEPFFDDAYSIPMPSFLRLRATHRPDYFAPNGWDQKWTSALLCTARPDGKHLATHRRGAFEYRAMLPLVEGGWPSSWALDVDNDETKPNAVHGSIELDGAEFYNESLNSEYYCNVNSINHEGSNKEPDPATFPVAAEGIVRPPLIPDMHVMRTILHVIGDETMTTHIDGAKIAERRIPRAKTVGKFYWMLDMALGGGWPVVPPPSGEASLYVDWVRIWTAD